MRRILLVLTSMLMFALPSCAEDSVFDGRWWRLASYGRQIGFLSGDSDCSQYELRLSGLKFRSVYQQRELLEKYYSDDKNIRVSIRMASVRINKTLKPYKIENAEGAATHPEKHGYYDGLWWKGGDPKGAQLGFMEGYRSCLPNGRSIFPQPYEKYVDQITKWYNRSEDPENEYEKIVDVLNRFASKQKEASPK